MPGFGQVDYSLVRPLTTGAERMQQMESLGTMREQRAGMRQDRRFQAEKQQMGRAEYERDLKQIEDVRQAVIDNTVDNKLDQDGFVRSLYSIDPKLAIEAQKSFASQNGGSGIWDKKGKVGGTKLADANKNLLEQYAKFGAITPEEKESFSVINDERPYDVNDWLKSIAQARGKIIESIPAKIIEEEKLRPGKVETAGETGFASGSGSASGRINAETNAGGGVNPIINEKTRDFRKEFIDHPDVVRVSKLYEQFDKANDVWTEYKAGKADKYETDQSLAFFASKALDDGVVMPGEFARFGQGLSTPEAVSAFFKKMAGGGLKLDDTQRQGMINIVNRGYKTALKKAKAQKDNYVRLAEKNNVDPDDVIGGYDYLFDEPKSVGAPTSNPTNDTDSLIDSILQGK